jgi:hypothetical protein
MNSVRFEDTTSPGNQTGPLASTSVMCGSAPRENLPRALAKRAVTKLLEIRREDLSGERRIDVHVKDSSSATRVAASQEVRQWGRQSGQERGVSIKGEESVRVRRVKIRRMEVCIIVKDMNVCLRERS